MEAACPQLPQEITEYPSPPVFADGETWDQWADANQNWGLALAARITAQTKWKAEHWKNCKVK